MHPVPRWFSDHTHVYLHTIPQLKSVSVTKYRTVCSRNMILATARDANKKNLE
jgi:hypothetical protein